MHPALKADGRTGVRTAKVAAMMCAIGVHIVVCQCPGRRKALSGPIWPRLRQGSGAFVKGAKFPRPRVTRPAQPGSIGATGCARGQQWQNPPQRRPRHGRQLTCRKIARASLRDRECQYLLMQVTAGSVKNKSTQTNKKTKTPTETHSA